MHPIEHGLVSRLVVTESRRRRNCGRDVFHKYDVDPGGIDRNMNFCRFARFSKIFFSPSRTGGSDNSMNLAHAEGRLSIETCLESLRPMIIDR
jgi:hypothetical protein